MWDADTVKWQHRRLEKQRQLVNAAAKAMTVMAMATTTAKGLVVAALFFLRLSRMDVVTVTEITCEKSTGHVTRSDCQGQLDQETNHQSESLESQHRVRNNVIARE